MRRGGLDGVSLLVLAGQAGDEVADDDEGRIEFKMTNFDFLSGRSVLLLNKMEYTLYGDSGTVTVGRYQNSGASTGTLDINILGHVGHTLPLPSSFSSSVPVSQLCSY